tara:strand:+ start:87 stop:638 length:552 start_codon:yes stop_codon:yes gene_type:complete
MKKILGLLILSLLIFGKVNANELILSCPYKSIKLDSYYYLDTVKKIVGHAYYNKDKKKFVVYKWWYKNAEFNKNKIIFNDPSFSIFALYQPENSWLNKSEINRINPSITHYTKSDDYIEFKDKYSYLPDVIQEQIAKKTLKWKFVDSLKCSPKKIPENILFMTKKEWTHIRDEQIKKENTPKF